MSRWLRAQGLGRAPAAIPAPRQVRRRRCCRSPAASCSSARTGRGASSSWIHDQMPPPSPTIGNWRSRTGLIMPSSGGSAEPCCNAGRCPPKSVTAARGRPIAARAPAKFFAGAGSSGSSSVLNGPPSRAYRENEATLCATNRCTPPSRQLRAARPSPSFAARWSSPSPCPCCAELHVRQRGRLVGRSRPAPPPARASRTARASSRSSPHRLRAKRLQPPRTRRGTVGAGHFVPSSDQLRNDPTADGAARSGEEHTHGPLLSFAPSLWRRTGEARGTNRSRRRERGSAPSRTRSCRCARHSS